MSQEKLKTMPMQIVQVVNKKLNCFPGMAARLRQPLGSPVATFDCGMYDRKSIDTFLNKS